MQLREGSELQSGKYRIVRVLGQGGFGITYLAEHTMLDKLVAVKEFFPKEYCDRDESTSRLTIGTKNSVEIVEMLKSKFVKEARNISKLSHRNIITIHDIFEENDTAYYVMEYVGGQSLAQMVKDNGALTEHKAVGYILRVADAVGYMHSLSMNHLDLKPANIMVRSIDDEPILIDFGLSKQYDASGGQTSSTPIGISHGYAPIEQYRPGGVASFTPQTDIYALGATLFNLITGNVPPHYSEILEEGLPDLPSGISENTVKAIEHAMEIKKVKRPATVKDFISEISDTFEEVTYSEVVEPIDVLPSKPSKIGSTTPTQTKQATHQKHPYFTQPDFLNENSQDVSHTNIDDTLMIGEAVPIKKRNENRNSIFIDGVEFVDLGLSVKWANMNIGAKSAEDSGKFFEKRNDGNLNDLFQWNTWHAIVPSISHFEELISRCRWVWTEQNDQMGYSVMGPNGNSIFLPVTGDGHNYPGRNLVTFGLLWTNEALLNEWRTHSRLLYYNSSTHQLATYSTDKRCPIRLVIR